MKRGGMSRPGYDRLTTERTEDMLESENNKRVDELRSKVTLLKEYAIDIGDEVKSQNKDLESMSFDFDSIGNLLKSSLGRVSKLTQSGNSKFMCYLILFVVAVFIVIYYLIR